MVKDMYLRAALSVEALDYLVGVDGLVVPGTCEPVFEEDRLLGAVAECPVEHESEGEVVVGEVACFRGFDADLDL